MITPLSNSLFPVETYSSLGKKETLNQEAGMNQSSFFTQVFQSIPEKIQDLRAHENSVSLAAQGKISSLDLLQKATTAQISLTYLQAPLKEMITAIKGIEQIPL